MLVPRILRRVLPQLIRARREYALELRGTRRAVAHVRARRDGAAQAHAALRKVREVAVGQMLQKRDPFR